MVCTLSTPWEEADPSRTLGIPDNRRTGEQFCNIEMTERGSNHPRASLLGLPLELRQQVYHNIFHIPTDSRRGCEVTDLNSRDAGCRCGEGLSVASKDLYQDTRSRFYNCASFAFRTPMACKAFVESIGRQCVEVGSLDISYQNNVYESSLLQGIFEPLKNSIKLCHLQLRIQARAGEPIQDYPLYMQPQTANGEAYAWDIEFRPIRHPLAKLKALQKLTIIGHPGNGEMEEVLYKASKNIEQFALSSGHRPYTLGIWARGLVPSYTIESLSY